MYTQERYANTEKYMQTLVQWNHTVVVLQRINASMLNMMCLFLLRRPLLKKLSSDPAVSANYRVISSLKIASKKFLKEQL